MRYEQEHIAILRSMLGWVRFFGAVAFLGLVWMGANVTFLHRIAEAK